MATSAPARVPPRAPMRRGRRVAAAAGAGVGVAALLLVGFAVFVNATAPGQRLVLDVVLRRTAGAYDGTLTVGGIRSRGLLRGATLTDVALVGPEGRPFLVVDSAQATWDWRTFVAGDVVLSSLTLWGPSLTLSRYPGEEELNVQRIFRLGEAGPEREPGGRIAFEDVRLVDGRVEVLLPVSPDDPPAERAVTVELPGVADAFHLLAFDLAGATLPEVAVMAPGLAGPEVRVASLALVGHVFRDPFRLQQLRGKITWAGGRLLVAADELSLDATRARGRVVADFTPEGRGGRETGWVVEADLLASRYELADLRWLLPDLPEGGGEGRFEIRATDLDELTLSFRDATLATGGSNLSGEGTLLVADGLSFRDVRLRMAPLALETLEPFTGEAELPFRGTLDGNVVLDGTLERLAARGVLTLREPGRAPTTADFRGTFHLGQGPGVTDLVATLAPLDWALVGAFLPDAPFEGTGRATITATGSLERDLRFRADLLHEPGGGLPASRVLAEGAVTGAAGGDPILDVMADVAPLSLTTLASYYPDLPVTSEVTGTIQTRGRLSDLQLVTDLETEAGRLAFEARFDAREPGAYYRVEAELGQFAVSRLFTNLPEPTVYTGHLLVEGRGTDLRTATVDAVLRARDSRVGELEVDTARVAVRVRDGVFHVDEMGARVAGVDLTATGTLAAHEDGPGGEIRVVFAAESLEGLRPLLTERNGPVRDAISELEREVLLAEGVEPGDVREPEEIALGGRGRGEVTLSGSLQRFSAAGTAELEEVTYGTSFLGEARARFSAGALPDLGAGLELSVSADSVLLAGRSFASADVELSYARTGGRFDVLLERDATEDYRARARFELTEEGGLLEVEALALRMGTTTWSLEGPGVVAWDEEAIRTTDLVLVREGAPEVRITAGGVLPRVGQADFALDVRGLRLEELGQVLQLEAWEMGGRVDADLRILGTAGAPLVTGSLDAREVRYLGYAFDVVEGGVDYRDRRVAIDLDARHGALRVLHAEGTVPAVLDLREPTLRFPDEPIALRVSADSLPAAFLTRMVPDLLDVEGTVAGDFRIDGTLDNPEPSGVLSLQGAGWFMESVGVRHRNVQGTLTLRPDGTTEVDASAQADGVARLTGTVRLQPLSNPTFDLTASFNNFRAVDRRDVFGNVTGIVTLTGTFERPVLEGLRARGHGLRVERAVLYLEEFARAAAVVDLADPRFAGLVDPTLIEPRIIEESQNPFMQNLRVNVDVDVEQDTWLRSTEMNVEMGGRLAVAFDRAQMDMVLVGELQAVRGSYTVLGRRFEVQQGRVEFVGIPGIDPNLDIVARTRVRRQNTEPLDIVARVTGSLTQPRVDLASEEAAMSQADLVSYLLFGRPSYELASGQRAVLDNAAGAFVHAGLGVVGSVFSGAVATRLGAVLARQWGLDYFAITEVGSALELGSVTQTQVEIGQYLTHDLFLVLAFQPAQVVGSSSNPFNVFGLRLEYSPADAVTLEAYWEDRFLRSRALGFQDLAFENRKILGLFMFTEWGY